MPPDRKTVATGVAIVAALAGGFGIAKFLDRRAPAAAEKSEEHSEGGSGGIVKLTPAQAAAAGVSVVSVGQGGGSDLRLTGRVESAPDARAVVAAPAAGSVVRVLVAPGASVGAGAGLAVIRSPEGAAAHAEAVAAAAEATAAQAALGREERLMKAGVTPRQDFETAQAAAARATANAGAARAKAGAFGSPGVSGEAMVRSPIAGVVTAVQVAAGGYVAQGGVVAEVANSTRVEVVFNASAEAAAKIRTGMPLKIAGADGSQADAVVIGVAPLAQDSTGAAMIRARLTGGRLTPGAAVSAAVATEGPTLPTVPTEAVQTLGGRSVVFVAVAGGFKPQTVTPGRSGGGYTQIVAGLKGDERVAGRGAFLLKAELSKGAGEEE
ncbi:efflux RND transporter periplasmic adaptor subunit [Phenylobacterium sp.]|uniref:efflux RND transporter periplasmic adaptor subunit n=1 Tax=Phenylobacterium sp. TaxID=1871053 RepID=UPI00374CC391